MDFVKFFKKAQLTLFIIMAILIVVSVSFLFIKLSPRLNLFDRGAVSPSEAISNCIENVIKDSEKEFFDSRDLLLDTQLVYRHNQDTMPFLCYSTEFYMPCVPQSPLFIESVRKNMENKASRELSRCVLKLKEDYERKGYTFDYSSFNFVLTFNELEISYSARVDITIFKGDETILISTKEGSVPTLLPKMLRTAETIVNYESVFCEFNHVTWQALNRDILIKRFRGGDQTKVYSLEDRNSGEEIKFAIRTCVMPAGI
jgi:hypothetical protein